MEGDRDDEDYDGNGHSTSNSTNSDTFRSTSSFSRLKRSVSVSGTVLLKVGSPKGSVQKKLSLHDPIQLHVSSSRLKHLVTTVLVVVVVISIMAVFLV